MWWQRKPRPFDDQWRRLQTELEHEINPLPVEEAKRRGEALLHDPAKFEYLEAPPEFETWLETLGPVLRALFTRYAGVEDVKGGCRFDRDQIGQSSEDPVYYAIGMNAHQDDLWVKLGEEPLYELFPGESQPIIQYSTIYHYLIYADRENALISSPTDAVELAAARERWLQALLRGRR